MYPNLKIHTSFISAITFFQLNHFLFFLYAALEHTESYDLKKKNKLFDNVMTPLGCTNKRPYDFKDRVTSVI